MLLSWNEWYELAKKYYEYHRNLLIPQNFRTKNGYEYDENGYNLGQWIAVQRLAYRNINIPKEVRKNTFPPLTPSKIQLLEEIEMVFQTRELNWEEWYSLAKNYYEYHGNLLISRNFKTKNGYEYDESGYNLGDWINNLRTSYKNINTEKEMRKNTCIHLTKERLGLLNKIGMVFNTYQFNWNDMYNLAKSYYQYHGNLLINCNFKTKNGYEYDESGCNLGDWIIAQRVAHKNKTLKKYRIELLEEIGMVFDVRKFEWNNMYNLAKNYYEHHGNLLIPAKFKTKNGYEYDEDGYNLGGWIRNQRTAYLNVGIEKDQRKTKFVPLTNTQIELLEEIGMVFSIRKNKQKSIELCEIFSLDYKKYSYLIERNTYKELNAKINFLIDNHYPVLQCERPYEIFFMSDVNMMTEYGISKKELIEKYYYEPKKEKIKIIK